MDNTLALGVKPYGGVEQQLNPMNMLLAASQLRNSDTQNELQKAQLQAANTEIQQKKAAYVGQLAGEVLTAPDDQLVPTYKEKLAEARKAGILDDSGYQQALSRADSTPPAQLRQMLSGLQMRSLPVEHQIAEAERLKAAPQIEAWVRNSTAPTAPKPQGYFNALNMAESGNNPNATPVLPAGSPSTLPRGPAQIKEQTWEGLARNNPDAGLTTEGFLGKAPDAADQHKTAVRLLTAENAGYLRDNDIQPTDKNLRMAHFLGGPDAARFIKGVEANPNAPATSLVSKRVVEDNPRVFLDSAGQPKTALGVYNSQTAGFSSGSTLGLTADSSDVERVKAATNILNNRAIDPSTKAMVLQQISPNFGFQTTPDGTIIRTNPRDGSVVEVYKSGKPKFTEISEGVLGKEFGFVDEAKQTVNGKPIAGANSGGAAPGAANVGSVGGIPLGEDGEPMKGPALMSWLEKNKPAEAAGVKGVIAGDMNAGGRNLQKLLPLAKLVDSSLEQFDYQSRAKTRVDFTSGPSAREIKALNTAIYHASQLAQVDDKLGGVNVLPGVINPLIQGYKRNTGDAVYQQGRKEWDATSETLATEIAKALNGGAPHVADQEHWRKVFEAAGSPLERQAAIASSMKLLEGRTHALGTAYERGMGRGVDGMSFIDAPNKAAFQELMTTGKIAPKKAGASLGPAAPAAPDAPEAPKPPPGFVVVQ